MITSITLIGSRGNPLDQAAPDTNKVQSPCVWVCIIDADTGYCCGCGRTGDEVAGWIEYPEPQRREIVSTLEDRLKTIKIDPRREARMRRRARRRAQLEARSATPPEAQSVSGAGEQTSR